MAYKISSDCISCGACIAECPTSCISDDTGEFVIKESDCIDCGACVGVCPVDAPKPVD